MTGNDLAIILRKAADYASEVCKPELAPTRIYGPPYGRRKDGVVGMIPITVYARMEFDPYHPDDERFAKEHIDYLNNACTVFRITIPSDRRHLRNRVIKIAVDAALSDLPEWMSHMKATEIIADNPEDYCKWKEAQDKGGPTQ